MAEDQAGWQRCSSCKGDIDFEQTYYVCSVSTCNRGGTDLRFCSVECWDVHVPVMRHRDAGAVEKRSPTRAEWERENPPEERAASSAARSGGSTTDADVDVELRESGVPHEILIVVSKLKAYVRARSGMNTSDSVMEALSETLRRLCDDAIRSAARDGRKTVMDRDFRSSSSR
ncbi:MAG: hypothetical protein ACREQ9_11690 [Candidatus Binatia bacterium]